MYARRLLHCKHADVRDTELRAMRFAAFGSDHVIREGTRSFRDGIRAGHRGERNPEDVRRRVENARRRCAFHLTIGAARQMHAYPAAHVVDMFARDRRTGPSICIRTCNTIGRPLDLRCAAPNAPSRRKSVPSLTAFKRR